MQFLKIIVLTNLLLLLNCKIGLQMKNLISPVGRFTAV